MARNTDIVGSAANMVNPINKHAMVDGHGLNHSYKIPAANASGRENSSYMHPHAQPLNFDKPWSSVDKTLAEASRHPEQLSLSKTVFPVATEKVRGAPRQPSVARNLRPAAPKII